jgi:tRNA modification GTPase
VVGEDKAAAVADDGDECSALRCRAALVTAPGRGAIATILLRGADAPRVVARHFSPLKGRAAKGHAPLHDEPARPSRQRAADPCASALCYGRWGSALSEEVVLYRRADGVFEIHCHGGRAAAAAILASLEPLGCDLLDWKQYVAGAESTIRADALLALAAASTERAAGILLDQLDGAIERAVQAVLQRLPECSETRRPEGGTRGIDDPRFDGGVLVKQLEELLDRWEIGLHLVQPWRVVVAGRPNVGKSTLINALLGYERAVTSQLPGTTRDLVTAQAALDGWPVELIDTAGLRYSDDELEREGARRADAVMRDADLCILVFDRSAAIEESDVRLIVQWPEAVSVANKCDLPAAEKTGLPERALAVSALHGEGIEQLARLVAERLVPQAPPAGTAVPFTARQAGQLRRALASAQAGQWQRVAEALQLLVEP